MAFFLLIVLLILGFAFYGFVCFCLWVVKQSDSPLPPAEREKEVERYTPDEIEDVRGAERLLNHLYLSRKIEDAQYDRIRDILEKDYKVSLQEERLQKNADGFTFEVAHSNKLADEPNKGRSKEETETQSPTEVEPIHVAQLIPELSPTIHPLDAPDETPEASLPPSPSVPQRSFAEMMAGFMEKRNIRWGELASGLLIVGSAVGLVISLRDELQDRIPYFSALVFMLITAAIHGAGTYTLKRWKLRNTSRGVLLIGMLLIPLNFLAACLLNGSPEQRRALSDPLLWIAVGVGTVAYSAMSWFSTRNLFQIRHLGTAICVVTCGVSILAINRVDEFTDSIVNTWLLDIFKLCNLAFEPVCFSTKDPSKTLRKFTFPRSLAHDCGYWIVLADYRCRDVADPRRRSRADAINAYAVVCIGWRCCDLGRRSTVWQTRRGWRDAGPTSIQPHQACCPQYLLDGLGCPGTVNFWIHVSPLGYLRRWRDRCPNGVGDFCSASSFGTCDCRLGLGFGNSAGRGRGWYRADASGILDKAPATG